MTKENKIRTVFAAITTAIVVVCVGVVVSVLLLVHTVADVISKILGN